MINVRLATSTIHSFRSLSSNSHATWRFRAHPPLQVADCSFGAGDGCGVVGDVICGPRVAATVGAPAHQQAGGARGHRGGFQSLHRVDPIGANATRSVLILGLGEWLAEQEALYQRLLMYVLSRRPLGAWGRSCAIRVGSARAYVRRRSPAEQDRRSMRTGGGVAGEPAQPRHDSQ
jgi:hypothetical protein